jgi:hypothetical protein
MTDQHSRPPTNSMYAPWSRRADPTTRGPEGSGMLTAGTEMDARGKGSVGLNRSAQANGAILVRALLLVLLGATFVLALLAQPALAQGTPPSLAGPPLAEQFAATTTPFPPGFGGYVTVDSKSCNADGSGSATFTADGTATGDYPGHFHETGTIELAPAVGGVSRLIRADANFTITSPNGNVEGTKHLDPIPGNNAAICGHEPTYIDPGGFLNFTSQQAQTYQATITTAQGQFTDSGTGGSTFQTSYQGPGPVQLSAFTEAFQTSNGVTPTQQPPTIACPPSMTVEANQTGGASVTPGRATASGNGVTITGPSAGFYPLGDTAVTYMATDSSGATDSCTTHIKVVDTTPPSLSCPSNRALAANPDGTATVSFTATASDIAGPVTVASSPASGSAFPVGTSTVTVTAKDQSGNTSTCSFTVTVKPTAESICNQTLRDVQGSDKYKALPQSLRDAIDTRVRAACHTLATITAQLTPDQKNRAIAAYKLAVAAIARLGWLTSAQASDLATQADQL